MKQALWIVALVVIAGAVNKYVIRTVWPTTVAAK